MANIKFNINQIEKFSDKIDNCLSDAACRSVLHHFLATIMKKANLLRVMELWMKADQMSTFNEDILELTNRVDGFNDDPLLTLSEPFQKIAYVKSECCRLFDRANIHKRFIDYLQEEHKA